MTIQTRSFLVVPVLVLTLAACSGTAAESADDAAESAAPTTSPSAAPSESPDASTARGTFTMVDGVSAGGPGVSIADAIANANNEPVLVNGVLLMDPDGTIWLCESLNSSSAGCGGQRLRVIGYPEGTADLDLENAGDTGLQEADGVLYFETAQLYGVVEE
jgi:hypothetical protein